MILQPDRVDWGWVGDSRLYHFNGATLKSRTKDHSYVEQQIDEGQWREEDRNKHPNRNLLLQALGHSEPPVPSFGATAPLSAGDTFLLCTDGLWDYFADGEIGKALASLPPRKAAEMLISAARVRAKGRGDNLSVAIVKLTQA
jgi:serine/threonine protein phosphatase PrpC